MTSRAKDIGNKGESIAADFLEEQGIQLLTTNYHCKYGEVDIIGKFKDILIFFEVKTRTSMAFGYPEESITEKKKDALITSAACYIQQENLGDIPWRIDVVAVSLIENRTDIEWLENAITS